MDRNCLNLLLLGALLLSQASMILSIPVDNGVEGEPEIECGPTMITVNFNTINNFEGHVYVKGRFAEPDCRNSEAGRQVAGIGLDFSQCGVKRTRSANPKGIFVETTVVITFHPKFITKVDRAYRIQCFYMEADKTVSTEIEVSMLTTGFATRLVPMPVCRYEILDGGPSGPIIRYAIVGQPVYHKWTCDSETVDTFCMVVHSCFVDDGSGDRVDLLNSDGCAIDRNLLGNLEYPTDLMAGQEAHVFKYADRPQLFFQCQISISVKEPNQPCTLPACPEPNATLGKRKKRSEESQQSKRHAADVALVDVATGDIDVIDLLESRQDDAPMNLYRNNGRMVRTSVESSGYCVTAFNLGTILAVGTVSFVAGLFVFIYVSARSKTN